MSKKIYSVGYCKVCKQGMLEIQKEISTGKIFVCCDECEAEWLNPEDAIKGQNGSRDHFGASSDVSQKEVLDLGWGKYLK